MLIPLQNLLAKIMETIVSEKAYQCSHCTISLLFYPKHVSLFFFQALVPQEAEAKAEVFNNSSSPHYFCTI